MNLMLPGFIILLLVVVPASSFSLNLSAGIAAFGSLAYNSFNAIKCRLIVCCTEGFEDKHIQVLRSKLKSQLHGQHLVQKTVANHIKGHIRSANPPKALVLSLHGGTGVGKNFVSRIIAESLYKDGTSNPFVHLISATKEFPHEGMVTFYKVQLKSWIEGNVTRCQRSMFIFDEVDKLPSGLLDVIKPYLDYYDNLGGIDYKKAIFIFLSNTGGSDIARVSMDHWRGGKKRESLELSDVENRLTYAAIGQENEQGMWHSSLIASHLITAFVPLLPLEKEHVRECVRDTLLMNYRLNFRDRSKIPNDLVDKVLKELTFYPPEEKIFSSTGCKRVAEKVDYIMMDEEFETDNLKESNNKEL